MKAEFRAASEFPVKAGEWTIVDPCYIYGSLHTNDDVWDTFCEIHYLDGLTFKRHGSGVVKIFDEENSHEVFIFPTAYGDGCYPAFHQNGEEADELAGVDSGLLCIIPYQYQKFSTKITIDKDTVVHCENGQLIDSDGNILVDTRL